jgi:transcriptional regulator with XRE-family HTH domain
MADPFASMIGSGIKTARLRRGMTLTDLANKSGIHISNLSPIEAGKRTAGRKVMLKIAAALGCRIDISFRDKSLTPSPETAMSKRTSINKLHPCECGHGNQCVNCINGFHAGCSRSPKCRKKNSLKIGLAIIVKSSTKKQKAQR